MRAGHEGAEATAEGDRPDGPVRVESVDERGGTGIAGTRVYGEVQRTAEASGIREPIPQHFADDQCARARGRWMGLRL